MSTSYDDDDNKFQREPLAEVLTDSDDVFVVFDFFKTWNITVPPYLKKACDDYSQMLDDAENKKANQDQVLISQNNFRVALCRAIYDIKEEPVFQEELLSNAIENARQIVLFNDFSKTIEENLMENK